MQGLKEILHIDVSAEDVAQSLRHYSEGDFIGLGNYPPEKNQIYMRLRDMQISINVAVFRHLGYDIPDGDIDRIVKVGPAIAIDYFYGTYFDNRDGFPRAMGKRSGGWLEVYRNGLLLALILCDEETVCKLTDWIDPTLPFDETSHILTVHDNNYHKLLAEFLRPWDAISHNLRESFTQCKLKRPKLLLDCLGSICANDSVKFSSSLADFLIYYKKTQFNKGGFDSLFSIEGSILWHVANRAGIDLKELSQKQSALIMNRESLGLAS